MALKNPAMQDAPTPERWARYIDSDLPHLHRERWSRINAELKDRIDNAQGADRDALERELGAHRADRFNPQSSRAAILKEIVDSRPLAPSKVARTA